MANEKQSKMKFPITQIALRGENNGTMVAVCSDGSLWRNYNPDDAAGWTQLYEPTQFQSAAELQSRSQLDRIQRGEL